MFTEQACPTCDRVIIVDAPTPEASEQVFRAHGWMQLQIDDTPHWCCPPCSQVIAARARLLVWLGQDDGNAEKSLPELVGAMIAFQLQQETRFTEQMCEMVLLQAQQLDLIARELRTMTMTRPLLPVSRQGFIGLAENLEAMAHKMRQKAQQAPKGTTTAPSVAEEWLIGLGFRMEDDNAG